MDSSRGKVEDSASDMDTTRGKVESKAERTQTSTFRILCRESRRCLRYMRARIYGGAYAHAGTTEQKLGEPGGQNKKTQNKKTRRKKRRWILSAGTKKGP